MVQLWRQGARRKGRGARIGAAPVVAVPDSAPKAGGVGTRAHSCGMSSTKQLPRAEWKDYFDRFTREFLSEDRADDATIEVMSPTLGDQFEVSSARLLGIDCDPKAETFEILVEDLDHLVFEPTEIWILEDEPGFVSTIEVVQADGTKQIIYLRSSGAATDDSSPRPAGGPGAPADR